MEHYLLVKWLHILSATLMFGTGFGTAFYLFVANRSGNVAAIAVVSRWVVRADWWFTTPAVIIQPLSGWLMIRLAGYPLDSFWIVAALALYALAGACWLPVVWLQLQMRDMALQANTAGAALPPRYWRYEKIWTLLGFPAFGGLLIVYWLMVAKPV
ncbi:DUF2269 family protein [Chitinilyticum piscinae]|uniref:DUF2269 domain-containing protein n=1 Tax=Chitinilyticum piscinae TaxID=2866724 RepID=A0A8J7FSZ8_9NEIS|nr:DUF2269 domain-containing protein [Chitinilyticum piscinae]MBE9609981.1 DUF2269 domain-containing protein [Chitinilyticum piscinae]